MSDHDTQIRYGRLDTGLQEIEDLYEQLIHADFGDDITALTKSVLALTNPIRELITNQTHVFEAEYLSDAEDNGYRLRFDFFNKKTAVLEVSTAFTHGWHNARRSPKTYNDPKIAREVVDEFIKLARETRGEDALKAMKATTDALLAPAFMKNYRLHLEERMEHEERLSMMWFPHDYDGVVIRVDMWLVTPTALDEENDKPKKHLLH